MSDLDRLFYWHGIAPDFTNYKGQHIQVSLENRKNLLETMGVDVSSPAAISKAAYELDVAPWESWVPPLSITPAGDQASIGVNCHPSILEEELSWLLTEESTGSTVAEGRFKPSAAPEVGDYIYNDIRYSRRELSLPSLLPNYYTLTLVSGGRSESTVLVAHPDSGVVPSWLSGSEGAFGLIIQLYTLRSSQNWGIGDFNDLQTLIRYSAKHGIETIGLNPLHALLPEVEDHCSPYSPSDRRHINPLYISLTNVPEYQWVLEAMPAAEKIELEAQLQSLRSGALVNYTQVRALKLEYLDRMFACFMRGSVKPNDKRLAEYNEFVALHGAVLERFALFEVMKAEGFSFDSLVEKMDCSSGSDEYQKTVAKYQYQISSICYQQWLASTQFAECQMLTRELGMPIGLIRDLAVGADRGGAEVLSNQHLFCGKAAAGAPPDAFSAIGQNWGLPPMDPAGLRRTGFAHFRELLRSNMANCGALRIDHAMGLMRLWWCPPGKTADYGAYVYYPFEELIALLKLESVLNDCVVIGEDLGIVPHNFRETMAAAGVVSNKVFYFERTGPTTFKSPYHYDTFALAMINNHDVPTLASWWDCDDIRLRQELNTLGEGANIDELLEERCREKEDLYQQLANDNYLPQSWHDKSVYEPADEALIFAIMRWMANVNSKLYVIQLEDLMMMKSPVNVPGTYKEHANWQRKLSLSVEELQQNTAVSDLLTSISNTRKNKGN